MDPRPPRPAGAPFLLSCPACGVCMGAPQAGTEMEAHGGRRPAQGSGPGLQPAGYPGVTFSSVPTSALPAHCSCWLDAYGAVGGQISLGRGLRTPRVRPSPEQACVCAYVCVHLREHP